MQENYEDGSKGEIRQIAWEHLLEEIKKSLDKKGVESVTIMKIGVNQVGFRETKNLSSLLGDFL